MPQTELQSCAYHIVRYAPNLVRDEWINIGVVLFDPTSGRVVRRLVAGLTVDEKASLTAGEDLWTIQG